MTDSQTYKVADLFAGLGGFHQALANLGHATVFASELNQSLRDLYEKNFGLRPHGDITEVALDDIPPHDILCGGFPCQPFSKSGHRRGFADDRGQMIFWVKRILDHHKPRWIILENVPTLLTHNKGDTWREIEVLLAEWNPKVRVLSPHEFGIPQQRKRAFIVGDRRGTGGFAWPARRGGPVSFKEMTATPPAEPQTISASKRRALHAWQDLFERVPEPVPSYPTWAFEWHSPQYDAPADWRTGFRRRNHEYHARHRAIIDKWLADSGIMELIPSYQKIEWQVPRDCAPNIWDHIIQFRMSGIRIKRSDLAPALTVTDYENYLAWQDRLMTLEEAAKLQSMENLKHLPEAGAPGFKAFGNAVNVQVVEAVARNLLEPQANSLLSPRR